MMPISSHLDRTSLVNKYGQKITPKNFSFVGTKQAILRGHGRLILPARVTNQNTGFASSCLLAGQPYNKWIFFWSWDQSLSLEWGCPKAEVALSYHDYKVKCYSSTILMASINFLFI